MAQTYLTEVECLKAENANKLLQEIPGKIDSSISTFRYAISNATIKSWVEDTELGADLKSDLERYCNSLEIMSNTLKALYQTIDSLIVNSRRNNRGEASGGITRATPTGATPTSAEPPSTNPGPSGSTEDLAAAVIRGEYGNGEERRAALGDRYDEVQTRVTEIMHENTRGTTGGNKNNPVTAVESSRERSANPAPPQASGNSSGSYAPNVTNPKYTGDVLNRSNGRIEGPSGQETYYNLPMGGVINLCEDLGIDLPGEYWVRDDGVKMIGDYVMVAANLDVHPRGSIVDCSLGKAIVVDTGGFAKNNPNQLDIAVNW